MPDTCGCAFIRPSDNPEKGKIIHRDGRFPNGHLKRLFSEKRAKEQPPSFIQPATYAGAWVLSDLHSLP
jgi:hypothetical protein